MSVQQPIADVALSYTASGSISGAVVVDLALSPAGDAALVTGQARLVQDLVRFMVTPIGSQFNDPTYGTTLWALLGRPTADDDEVYISAVEEAEAAFLHWQTRAVAAGYLDVAATLARITDTRVDRSTPGVVAVGFTAHSKAGESVHASAPVGG